MIRLCQSLVGCLAALCLCVACKPDELNNAQRTLPIGIIVSEHLDGPARARDTVRCAELSAAAHNRRGGVLIDGVYYRVELRVADYGDDPIQAVRIASNMIHNDGVRYFIGPNTGRSLAAVTPLYHAAGVLFAHSDMNYSSELTGTLSLRASPDFGHGTAMLCEFLKEERAVDSVVVVAGMQSGAVEQKIRVEQLAERGDISIHRLARYDVHEEVYNHQLPDATLMDWWERFIQLSPDAIFLCGFLPETVPLALQSLKSQGYAGEIVVLDGRGPDLDSQMYDHWEGVLFMGGSAGDYYSEYYKELRADAATDLVQWNVESNVKLYALETIIRLVQKAGAVATTDPRALLNVVDAHALDVDPFFAGSRSLRIMSEGSSVFSWQIQMPTYISEVVDGSAVVLKALPAPIPSH